MKTQYSINYDAETISEAQEYLAYRYKQLLKFGVIVRSEVVFEDKAVVTIYNNDHCSIYILKQHRGKSLYKELLQRFMLPVVSLVECELTPYLSKIRCQHDLLVHSNAYKYVQNYYEDKRTERSGVPLIYHIDEGGYILNKLNADAITRDAYYLHPLLQSDEALKEMFYFGSRTLTTPSVILAMEYRAMANSYLSHNKVEDLQES